MDIKHVLVVQPDCMPAYRPDDRAGADPAGRCPSLDLDEPTRGGLVEIGHTGDGFGFDNECPRHRSTSSPSPSRPAGDLRRVARVHRRRRLPPARAVAVRRLGPVQAEGWDAPPLLVAGRRRVAGVHPRRLRARRPGPPGLPRQLLRGRRLRPLGGRPAADRGGVGGGRPTRRSGAARPQLPRPRLCCTRSGAAGGCSAEPPRATSGSGPRPPTAPTRASRPPPGRSASTTASSWSTSTCSAAARASPRSATSGPPTATSSPRRPAGPSPACAWPGRRTAGSSEPLAGDEGTETPPL